jgi:biotin operon repressor
MNVQQTFKQIVSAAVVAILAVGSVALAQSSGTEDKSSEWKPVQEAMGRPGKLQADDTFKFSMPRKDLHVTVAGTPIKPGLALGSWTAFNGTPIHAMVMGDLVITEAEVEPVMMKLQEEGIQETAVHNHLLNETPRIMYMHIEGHGNAVQMAKAIRDALALTKTPPPETGSPAAADQDLGIDPAQIGSILGHKAKVNGGIVQVSVPRAEKIMDQGMEVPPSMGTSTSLNFQPTGNGRAAITGDFVLLPNEVNPVLKALRENGIQVTALHSHMLNDQPHLLFMHFWANDDAAKLAKGLRAALNRTKSAGEETASKY